MNNTKNSFKDKWEKNTDCAFENTNTEGSDIFNWILNRNGFNLPLEFSNFLSNKKRILDAGCGNGRVTSLLRNYTNNDSTEIVGIDLVAAKIAEENLKNCKNVSFFQKDLLEDISDLGLFDFIYCQEVLHHTSNPRQAFSNLVNLLSKDGEIAIYVYLKKAPIREYVDDFIREKIADYPYEQALKICEQITELGKTLSNLNIKINVPDVEILEIKSGEYDLQRFIYHFFMKCFWNNELSFNDNSVINYDWYHPQLCSRHTLEEIKNWFKEEALNITHEHQDFYGITIRGKK
jgi:SAM-dependent methyltransferase